MLNRRATPIFANSTLAASTCVVAIFVMMFLTMPAAAQARGGLSTAGAGMSSGAARSGTAHSGGMGVGHGHGHSLGRRSTLFPYPYSYPYGYDYGDYEYDNQEPAPVQAAAPPVLNAAPVPPTPPRESLLIEWQGDHFVRTTLSQKITDGEAGSPDYSEKFSPEKTSPDKTRLGSASTHAVAVQPPRELPPAVLVFRDGRHEEISSYTIMSGTIYSKADYWTNGSWTKKIQIADLDVPATLKLNHENGLDFVLPAGPNEVVVRP